MLVSRCSLRRRQRPGRHNDPISAVAAATGMPRQSSREFAGTGTFPQQIWVTTMAPSAGKQK
jgi:hypothetical protein